MYILDPKIKYVFIDALCPRHIVGEREHLLLASASQRCHVVQLPPRSRLDEEWRLCRSVCRQINERCHVTARSRRTSSCRRIVSLYTIEYVSAPQCCSTGFFFAFSIHKTCHARAGVRAGVVFDCTTHAQRPRAPGQLSFTFSLKDNSGT